MENLRKAETNAVNYRLAVSGFLEEVNRMNLDIRKYLLSHPGELIEIALTA